MPGAANIPLPRLEDHVDLDLELGRGAFGVVRSGVLRRNGVRVAVKLSLGRLGNSEIQRILREFELIQKIQHPRLARLMEVMESASGGLALIYELVPGVSLEEGVRLRGPSLEEKHRWMDDLGQGLDALHQAGVLHRDIKPGNVILEPSGHARLLDFGLARPEASGATLTATGMILGTPPFMAPEALRGEASSRSSDLFSLAALAYWLFAGRVPFLGPSPGEILESQRRPPPTFDPRYDSTFARLLSPHPEQRPRSGAELVAWLERDQPTKPGPAEATRLMAPAVPVRSDTVAQESQSASKRWGSGLLAVMLLGGFLWSSFRSSEGEALPSPSPIVTTPVSPGQDLPFSRESFAQMRLRLEELQWLLLDPEGRPIPETLENSNSWRIADGDPIHWSRIGALFPEIGIYFDWLVDGGRPEDLPPEVLRELRKTDDFFYDADLPHPFLATLHPKPEEPIPFPQGLKSFYQLQAPQLPFPDHLQGWEAVCLQALDRCLLGVEEKNQKIRAGSPEMPKLGRAFGLHSTLNLSLDLKRLVIWSSPAKEARPSVFRWVRPEVMEFQTCLYALGRTMGEPGSAKLRTLCLVEILAEELAPYLLRGHLFQLPMEHLLGPEGPRIRETVLLEAQLSHAALKAAERVGAPLAGLRSRGTGYRERLGSIPLDKQDPYAFVAHVRAVSELAIRALNRGQNQEVMKHLGPLLDVYELGDPRAPREIFGALNHPLVALMRQPDPSALGIGKERLVKLTQMHSMLARFSPEKHWSALFEDAYESDHVRISSELPLENPGSIPGFLEEMIQLAH